LYQKVEFRYFNIPKYWKKTKGNLSFGKLTFFHEDLLKSRLGEVTTKTQCAATINGTLGETFAEFIKIESTCYLAKISRMIWMKV